MDPDAAQPEEPGSPVGRRVVLGLIGLAGLGVALGSRANSALTAISANDPTGLSDLIPGSSRFRFYSVAGRVGKVNPSAYELTIGGAVDKPRTFTYDQLESLPQTTMTSDVQCVTGWRVPNVAWQGVLLSDLLDRVEVRGGAQAVQFGSSDGIYTESLTMDQALRPDVLIATSLNGEAVSHDHGGPVRLYVAPMYFYKSLKWLNSITVADRVTPGYWEQRGYDTDAWVGESNGRDDAPII